MTDNNYKKIFNISINIKESFSCFNKKFKGKAMRVLILFHINIKIFFFLMKLFASRISSLTFKPKDIF